MKIIQVNETEAKKVIREYWKGKDNDGLRRLLREQLKEQLQYKGQVYLGYGVLFLNGMGNDYCKNFNKALNKALFGEVNDIE